MTQINQEAIDNILTRRSIRRFDPSKHVDDACVKMILECACAAPSANNYHPWHFVVIDKREILDRMAELHPYGKMLKTAVLAIVVCAETEREGKVIRYWEEDCSAAMQNMLLSANALGLGSVWLGVKRGDNDLEGLFCSPGNQCRREPEKDTGQPGDQCFDHRWQHRRDG